MLLVSMVIHTYCICRDIDVVKLHSFVDDVTLLYLLSYQTCNNIHFYEWCVCRLVVSHITTTMALLLKMRKR